MATVSATFIFALPEDTDSDQLLIYEASTRSGVYSLVDTVTYEYGTSTHEYDSADDSKWYKIKFNNSVDSEAGPLSSAVFGGNFNNASPFLAVSTGTDGANYATSEEVYEYASFTTEDIPRELVTQALRRSRATVDLKTADLNLDRFSRTFITSSARKKFNATLRILKEAEINIALSHLYRGLADDAIVRRLTEDSTGSEDFTDITIGDTTIKGGGLDNTEHMKEVVKLADRYIKVGMDLLGSIQSPSVRLHHTSDLISSPKFKYPFNGY